MKCVTFRLSPAIFISRLPQGCNAAVILHKRFTPGSSLRAHTGWLFGRSPQICSSRHRPLSRVMLSLVLLIPIFDATNSPVRRHFVYVVGPLCLLLFCCRSKSYITAPQARRTYPFCLKRCSSFRYA